MSYITEADVRDYLRDRSFQDNLLVSDVTYSSEDIATAMKSVAREFNSVPPLVIFVSAQCLPDDTNVFFDGIAAALMRSVAANATANDMDYSAGGVSANIQGNKLRNFSAAAAMYGDRFRQSATDIKIIFNLSQADGLVG